jgi:hypothetical protein
MDNASVSGSFAVNDKTLNRSSSKILYQLCSDGSCDINEEQFPALLKATYQDRLVKQDWELLHLYQEIAEHDWVAASVIKIAEKLIINKGLELSINLKFGFEGLPQYRYEPGNYIEIYGKIKSNLKELIDATGIYSVRLTLLHELVHFVDRNLNLNVEGDLFYSLHQGLSSLAFSHQNFEKLIFFYSQYPKAQKFARNLNEQIGFLKPYIEFFLLAIGGNDYFNCDNMILSRIFHAISIPEEIFAIAVELHYLQQDLPSCKEKFEPVNVLVEQFFESYLSILEEAVS